MGSSLGGGKGQMISDINITPFVDVMLVLLIIFMVATPLIEESDDEKRKVDIDLPVTRQNANKIDPEQTDKMILVISNDLKVSLRNAKAPGEDTELLDCSDKKDRSGGPQRFESCFNVVEQKLGQNPKLQEEKELYLLADTEIPYGFVVGVMARIRKAGVTKLGMVTNPEYLDEEGKK
jgi:biopolymer transport protein TolR